MSRKFVPHVIDGGKGKEVIINTHPDIVGDEPTLSPIGRELTQVCDLFRQSIRHQTLAMANSGLISLPTAINIVCDEMERLAMEDPA